MYSIPPKQFAIFSNFPKKYFSKSVAYNWGGNVTTLFSEKKGWGVSFFGRKLPNLGMETHPLVFSYAKG